MAINLRALYTKQNLIPQTFSRQKDVKISQRIRKLRCNSKLRWSSVYPVEEIKATHMLVKKWTSLSNPGGQNQGGQFLHQMF